MSGKCEPQAFWQAISNWTGVDAQLAFDDDTALDGKPDWIKAHRCRHGSVFEKWGKAMLQCKGDNIAVMSPYLIPADGWLEAMLAALDEGDRAYVGPVEEKYGRRDPGIIGYLVEYGHFHRTVSDSHGEIPGTNLVIRLDQLPPRHSLANEGFFKTPLLQAWTAEGYVPRFVKTAVVYHRRPFEVLSYRARRYWHGRSYGAAQRIGKTGPAILLSIAKCPLLPLVRVWRIGVRTRHVAKLRRAFRYHFLAILEAEVAWSAGEFAGYVWGEGGSRDMLD